MADRRAENSAYLLHDWLKALEEVWPDRGHGREALKRVGKKFEVDALEALATMAALAREVSTLMRLSGQQRWAYDSFDDVVGGLTLLLPGATRSQATWLNPRNLGALEAAGETLEEMPRLVQRTIPTEALDYLIDEIGSLQDFVANSGLPVDLAILLAGLLSDAERAVRSARIAGTAHLVRFRHGAAAVVESLEPDEADTDAVRRFNRIMSAVDFILLRCATGITLASALTPWPGDAQLPPAIVECLPALELEPPPPRELAAGDPPNSDDDDDGATG